MAEGGWGRRPDPILSGIRESIPPLNHTGLALPGSAGLSLVVTYFQGQKSLKRPIIPVHLYGT